MALVRGKDMEFVQDVPTLDITIPVIRMNTMAGKYLFDAAFFGVLPKDARAWSPSRRLTLECAWEAAELSGSAVSWFSERKYGTFYGANDSDHHSGDGLLASGADGHGDISYILNLLGRQSPLITGVAHQ